MLEGPQDAEALFARPSGELYRVRKGRHGPVSLYRLPRTARLACSLTSLAR